MGWKEDRDAREKETRRQWDLLNNEGRQRDVFNSSLLVERGFYKGMTRLQIIHMYTQVYGSMPSDAVVDLIMQAFD